MDRGSEVVNMFRYEYDHEAEMKAIREDGIEEGREEGIRALINTCRYSSFIKMTLYNGFYSILPNSQKTS